MSRRNKTLAVITALLIGAVVVLFRQSPGGRSDNELSPSPASARADDAFGSAMPSPVAAELPVGVLERRERWTRAQQEWQGMRVDDLVWPCGETTCARGRACIDGKCLPCASDSECEHGELCVLQYCLLEPNVGCQSRSDCTEHADALCVINGITAGDLRGNAETRSECLVPVGGREKTREQYEAEIAEAVGQATPAPSPGRTAHARALEQLRAARARRTPLSAPVPP